MAPLFFAWWPVSFAGEGDRNFVPTDVEMTMGGVPTLEIQAMKMNVKARCIWASVVLLAAATTVQAGTNTHGRGPFIGSPGADSIDVGLGTLGWSDDFDSYVTGSEIHGQGGWKGWFNDPTAGALVSDAQASSVPNSIAIATTSDLIQPFSGYTSGVWILSARQFIPASFTGESYFIVQNRYNDAGTDLSWSVQVSIDSALGTIANDTGGANPGSTPYVTDTWADLRLVIDLDTDQQTLYYNGTQVYTGSWTAQFVPNMGSGPGTLTIGALDLFANGASAIYYDDLSLQSDTIFVDGFDSVPF